MSGSNQGATNREAASFEQYDTYYQHVTHNSALLLLSFDLTAMIRMALVVRLPHADTQTAGQLHVVAPHLYANVGECVRTCVCVSVCAPLMESC